MRARLTIVVVGIAAACDVAIGGAPRAGHLNPLIDLLEQKKPVFGLSVPASPPGRPARTAADLANETVAYQKSDFVFSDSMETSVERGLPAFAEFAAALGRAGALITAPSPRLVHPLIVKTPKIARHPAKAIDNISTQLNVGVSGIMFVGVESADEVRQGLAAMRFAARGGTRPGAVGAAPKFWGLDDAQYKDKADLWPLNPNGELINWTVIDSKAGLDRVREIAAVKGIGVLWPGIATLRQVFTTTLPGGQRVFDVDAWEEAIQQVLAACKEFKVPCGCTATEADIEIRMRQGFGVFLLNWTEKGFRAVDLGRQAGGR